MPGSRCIVVGSEPQMRDLEREVRGGPRLAMDLEASGMFAYRAAICAIQLAWDRGDSVAVIDTLAVPAQGLRELLGAGGPVKIVHDVAFDARLLAEAGVELDNVHDTAVAARMLGRPATGLAALLDSLLQVRIGKEMQHHDWRIRPLDEPMLAYLVTDVAHLEALEGALWAEVLAADIEREVLEETHYRLASASAAARTPSVVPPYARIKGVERLAERERAVLAVIAELREREAMRRDVPPHRVVSNDALVVLARARPKTAAEVARTRGVGTSSPAARAFVEELVRGIASAGESLPPEERARFERPRVPSPVLRAKREREARVLAWRREEAKRRDVDEQVVLPGHCVKDLAEPDGIDVDGLARVPGIGAFRVERYGQALVQTLRAEEKGT
jgi:ribonuclease D